MAASGAPLQSTIASPVAGIDDSPPSISLLRYAPAALLVIILVADSNRHTDPDLWGHLRFGQTFIATRHLLDRDTYSYSAAHAQWRDHEWLAEVAMASIYNAGGVIGLKLWKFSCSALIVFFLADAEASTGAPATIQLCVLVAAALGLILQSQFRPQMFTFVLMSALMALLARDTYRHRAPLWLAVPFAALWANLHGGFFIGIAILALYGATAAIGDVVAGAGWRRGARFVLLTLAAAAATLLNPYGIGMWQTVAHALANPYTRIAIRDWQPLAWAVAGQWRSAPAGVILYAAVIATVLALAASFTAAPSREDLPLVAVVAAMAVATLLSARNLALVAIAACAPLARHWAAFVRRSPAEPATPAATRWRLSATLAALALAVAMALGGGLLSSRLASDRAYPAAALAFMRQHELRGHVLADFGWGEYLIWHAAPDDKVFIDGRYDTVYSLSVIRDYLDFHFDRPRAGIVLDSWPHDFVLIAAHSPARALMDRRRDWKLIYRDADALLYSRANAPAARLHGLPVGGVARTTGFP